MKKIFVIIMALVLSLSLVACGGDSADTENPEKAEKTKEEKVYGVGDTWTVDGQWSLTINSITPTDERNEFADTNPAEVVIVEYTYKNLGYEDSTGLMNGLFLDLESGQIIDAAGQMCESYPASGVVHYAQETPVGATCTAQAAFALTEAGPIEIIMNEYDGNDDEQKAKFKLEY